jgi:hypothetical protein
MAPGLDTPNFTIVKLAPPCCAATWVVRCNIVSRETKPGIARFCLVPLSAWDVNPTDTESVTNRFKIIRVILVEDNVISLKIDKIKKLC